MERTGIAIDSGYLSGLEKSFDGQVQNAAAEAYAVIGREVNLGSPKQLQEVLFDQLGMPKTKKIKTGYTTDAAALTDLFARTQHPFLEHLLAHRDAIRLRQTVEGLLRSVAAGRAHPHHVPADDRGDRAGCRPRTRTCRTSRSAPRPAGRSGARSWSATATRRC